MTAISVKNLSKTFTLDKRRPGIRGALAGLFHREKIAVPAVQSISFEITKGEFVGFVGPNGAGKTTTLKMLSGILYPTSGEAHVLSHVPWKRERRLQKRFALVMGQKNQMWWDLPVIESFEFNKTVYEIPEAVYTKQLADLSSLLDIERLLGVQVRKLSLGERMKCELACALLHRPEVLFLDEPTIGLDVISQKAIRDFLREYNLLHKATIILTSHYMEDIRRLCERVIIIDHGKVIYDGDYPQLVSAHADTKTIEVQFNETVPRERIEKLAVVSDYRANAARLTVGREKILETTTVLLRDFPVDDISIHEESMEEIVGGIFQSSRHV